MLPSKLPKSLGESALGRVGRVSSIRPRHLFPSEKRETPSFGKAVSDRPSARQSCFSKSLFPPQIPQEDACAESGSSTTTTPAITTCSCSSPHLPGGCLDACRRSRRHRGRYLRLRHSARRRAVLSFRRCAAVRLRHDAFRACGVLALLVQHEKPRGARTRSAAAAHRPRSRQGHGFFRYRANGQLRRHVPGPRGSRGGRGLGAARCFSKSW